MGFKGECQKFFYQLKLLKGTSLWSVCPIFLPYLLSTKGVNNRNEAFLFAVSILVTNY